MRIAALEIAAVAPLLIKAHQPSKSWPLTGPRYACDRQRATILAAQASSSLARLRTAREDAAAASSDSDTPVTVERAVDVEVAHVRQRRDAEAEARSAVGQRVLDRRHQVVHRPLEALDERGRHALRPGLHVHARAVDVHAVRVGLGHPRIDVDEGDAHTVDRDLELLAARGAAEQLAARRLQHQRGSCTRRRRERCARPRPRRACRSAHPRRAASATRCAARGRSPRSALAVRSPMASVADAARRAQVALHQRRRGAPARRRRCRSRC